MSLTQARIVDVEFLTLREAIDDSRLDYSQQAPQELTRLLASIDTDIWVIHLVVGSTAVVVYHGEEVDPKRASAICELIIAWSNLCRIVAGG
jgi:hypothetical protein